MSAPVVPDSSRRAVAPAWHTAIVLFIVLGFSFESGRSGNLPGVAAYGRAGGYVLVMIMEWGVVAFIWFALSRRGIRMADLIGGLGRGRLPFFAISPSRSDFSLLAASAS